LLLGGQGVRSLVATSAVFDDPNLVSPAGLVPVLALAGYLAGFAAAINRPNGSTGGVPPRVRLGR